MKKIFIYSLLFFVFSLLSCKSNTEENNSVVEMIPVILNKKVSIPIEELIERIELIPLETNSECLLHMYNKMVYYQELEIYAIFSGKYEAYLFSKDGKFIVNSKALRGPGPQQYQIDVDFLYNPYSKCMEFLDPWGTIYRYDTLFNFIEKISLEQKELIFHHFEPLNKNQYILL